MRPRHVHRVTPDDVGQRVTVRRYLDAERTEVGDVIGELVTYDEDGVLTIESVRGTVTVPDARVLASRVVPPRPTKD